MKESRGRLLAALLLVTLLVAIYWLDQHRSGPMSDLQKCSVLLARHEAPPANVLLVGSSRMGFAVDPVALQDMLRTEYAGRELTVERIAIPISPTRLSTALVKRYVANRGASDVIGYEIPFAARRAIENLADRHGKKDPEDYIFTRDVSVMTFSEIWSMPSVAMPYSHAESTVNLLRAKLRGSILRAGVLAYAALSQPFRRWDMASCDEHAWRRGGMTTWADDFEFSYAHSRHKEAVDSILQRYAAQLAEEGAARPRAKWQDKIEREPYAYDLGEHYRQGELVWLHELITLAQAQGTELVIQPLYIYGGSVTESDRQYLQTLGERVWYYDVYGEAGSLLDAWWHDGAHLSRLPAGVYTTALTAKFLIANGMLTHDR